MIGPIVVTALAVIAVAFAVLRAREFWRHPRPTDRLGTFDPVKAAGALPFLTVGLAVSMPIIAVGVWFGDERTGAPEPLQWLGGVTLMPTLMLGWSLLAFGRPQFLLPPWMRTAKGRERFHEVVVQDVRQAETTDYYVASCSCGWTGDTHPDEHTARAEAAAHAPNVRPELERPVA